MRRVLLPGALALVLAIGLVLALAGGEEDVSVEEPTNTPSEQRTGETGARTSESPRPERSDERMRVEQAVTRYAEAAERGEVEAPGLPTSDELTIRGVEVAGGEAQATLAGGTRLSLRRKGRRWRVVRVSARRIKPTPPSNG